MEWWSTITDQLDCIFFPLLFITLAGKTWLDCFPRYSVLTLLCNCHYQIATASVIRGEILDHSKYGVFKESRQICLRLPWQHALHCVDVTLPRHDFLLITCGLLISYMKQVLLICCTYMSGPNKVSRKKNQWCVMKDLAITLQNTPLKATALHSVNIKFFSFSSIKNRRGCMQLITLRV